MLIVLPLGLFVGGVVFDAISFWHPSVALVGFWNIAAGVIGGLLAAVFGLIDWLAIPARTRAKRIGLWHAGSNVIAILCFAAIWWLRYRAIARADSGGKGCLSSCRAFARVVHPTGPDS